MNQSLTWKIIWVVVYGITLFLTLTNSMMAMDWMAGAMFIEALVSLISYFRKEAK